MSKAVEINLLRDEVRLLRDEAFSSLNSHLSTSVEVKQLSDEVFSSLNSHLSTFSSEVRMPVSFVFHKLHVWHLAKGLVKETYRITKAFPSDERFGLVSQMNRAAVSVASNLAEGSGRLSRKDQAHFTQLAYGSLMELACLLEISCELGFMTEEELQGIHSTAKSIAEKLSALRSSQLPVKLLKEER